MKTRVWKVSNFCIIRCQKDIMQNHYLVTFTILQLRNMIPFRFYLIVYESRKKELKNIWKNIQNVILSVSNLEIKTNLWNFNYQTRWKPGMIIVFQFICLSQFIFSSFVYVPHDVRTVTIMDFDTILQTILFHLIESASVRFELNFDSMSTLAFFLTQEFNSN